MSIAENIRRVRNSNGLTQEEFGKIAGVSGMAVSQWENGRAVPRMGAVQALADHFGINKGEIVDDGHFKPKEAHEFDSGARPAFLPLFGRVHAGDAQEPELLDDSVPGPWQIAVAHPSGYFLKVEGNCMSKVYPEGCFILIDPAREPKNGSVAVVSIDGEDYVMRRLYRTSRTVVLSPDSWDDCYEDIVIRSNDEHTVEFVGTVVWFQPSEELE